MFKKNTPDRLKPHQEEKEYFLLRWPVIIIALLLVWPLGIISLILKFIDIHSKSRKKKILVDNSVPFAKYKTDREKQSFGDQRRRRKKTVFTGLIMTALFLVLGCIGITQDYLQVFFGSGFTSEVLYDFIGHAAFLLVGVYMASTSYSFIQRNHRLNHLQTVIGKQAHVSMDSLIHHTGYAEELIVQDLKVMQESFFFGQDAYYDEKARILYCRSE